MPTPREKFATHEQYARSVPPGARPVLARLQALVEAQVPGAERCISYNIPAYRLGKVFLYFAAFKRHVSVYPPVRRDAKLLKALAPYRNEKGNLRFALDEPLPEALIARVAKALAAEVTGG